MFNKKVIRAIFVFIPFISAVVLALLVGQGNSILGLESSFLLLVGIALISNILFFIAFDIMGETFSSSKKLLKSVLCILGIAFLTICGLILFFSHIQIYRKSIWAAAVYSCIISSGFLSFFLYLKKVQKNDSNVLSAFTPIISLLVCYLANVFIIFIASTVNKYIGDGDLLYFVIHVTFYVVPAVIMIKSKRKSISHSQVYGGVRVSEEEEIRKTEKPENYLKLFAEIEKAVCTSFSYVSPCKMIRNDNLTPFSCYTEHCNVKSYVNDNVVEIWPVHIKVEGTKNGSSNQYYIDRVLSRIENVVNSTIKNSEYAPKVNKWKISLQDVTVQYED